MTTWAGLRGGTVFGAKSWDARPVLGLLIDLVAAVNLPVVGAYPVLPVDPKSSDMVHYAVKNTGTEFKAGDTPVVDCPHNDDTDTKKSVDHGATGIETELVGSHSSVVKSYPRVSLAPMASDSSPGS